MGVEVWLAIISALLAVTGTLGLLGYKDFARRVDRLEAQDKKIFSAVLTLLIVKPDDHVAIANALHGLIANGVNHD